MFVFALRIFYAGEASSLQIFRLCDSSKSIIETLNLFRREQKPLFRIVGLTRRFKSQIEEVTKV
jgi:hypothetical protein